MQFFNIKLAACRTQRATDAAERVVDLCPTSAVLDVYGNLLRDYVRLWICKLLRDWQWLLYIKKKLEEEVRIW